MKLDAITREICGTESGYRKHKNNGEYKCDACKDAWNAWRREYARKNPDKNKTYRSTYAARHPERVQEQQQKYVLTPEQKAERALQRLAAKEARIQAVELERQLKAAAKVKQKEDKEAERLARIAANKSARAKKVEEYREQKAARLLQEKIANQYARAYQKAVKRDNKLTTQELEAVKQGTKEAKELARMNRPVAHGTTFAEYEWCKYQNGTACKPCRAAAAAYVRSRPNKKIYYKISDRNRRAYARQNGRESYTRSQVLERDNYLCHICNEPTDPSATHVMGQPGWERYPHIDHVIPVSKGGSDTLANVRTAHAECNLLKADTVNTPEITV